MKKKLMQILQTLGFVEKATNNQLTDDDWKKIEASFQEQFGVTIADEMAATERAASLEKERQAALNILNATAESNEDADEAEKDENAQSSPTEGRDGEGLSLEDSVKTIVSKLEDAQKQNKILEEKMDKMAKVAAPDKPVNEVSRKLTVSGPGMHANENYLFGIEHKMFDMTKRWNQIAQNPNAAKLSEPSKAEFKQYQVAVAEFAGSLAARYRYLKENKLDVNLQNAVFNNDLTELNKAGLGDQYVTLRQDALIARILAIPTVYDLFPRRYGVQDRDLMTIAYFDELSQAYQSGEVYKGGMKLQPELGYVDDAMFKVKFGPMKELERKYIGYLNTDGSDPIKWGMIEWQLLNMYTVLVNEQNKRVIRGCYVKPETGVAGSYLNAGTGLIYTLIRFIHENKLLPTSDETYNDYSETTMLDAVSAFIDDVKTNLDEDEELEGKFIYLNKKHRDWWKQCVRTKFGKDTDFTGVDSYVNVVPDKDIRIKWVPNMGNFKLMFIQRPGNLQAIEFVPGEMLAVDFDTEMEMVRVWSTWKEGFGAAFVGKTFATRAALIANNYSLQDIFMNKPAVVLEAGATTLDATQGFWFETVANAAATALTDITGAKEGVVYVLEIGSATNATTIAKSGKFANITAAFTPTAVSDNIMVVLGSDGKFLELERTVGGTRAINQALQPNIIGGR